MKNQQSLITEQDYNQALERLEDIFDAKPNTMEGAELEALANLIEIYENENFPIEAPNESKQKTYPQKNVDNLETLTFSLHFVLFFFLNLQ